jgi:hypothetical protein
MNKKPILYIALTLVILQACHTVKKVQNTEIAITHIDTTRPTVVKPTEVVDSFSIVKKIIGNLAQTRIDYTTFSAKVKVDYAGTESENNVTANINIRKDSAIWIDIRGGGALNIEVIRLLVTKDSLKLINARDKTISYRSISYLQQLSQVPLSFFDLQDIIVGNPVFVDSNVVSYKSTTAGLQVMMISKFFKNLVTLDNKNTKIVHSKLDDVDPMRNRTCDITYGDYQTQGNINFSTTREIIVAEQGKVDINLNFKQYNFNQPVSFPFRILKSYKTL